MPSNNLVDMGGGDPGMGAPATNAAIVTPADGSPISSGAPTRAILCGGAGTLTVDMLGVGTNILLTGLLAGQVLPVRVTKVYATGTSVNPIIALW